MPPIVFDVRRTDDLRDVVHRTVEALAAGKLVAFPTETVYGLAASALDSAAVQRLVEVKQRGPKHPLALAIKSAEEALDYVPDISPLGRRLARRCWPGPVTLVLSDNHPDSLIRQLPEEVCHHVVPNDTLGLRVPAHPLILDVLQLMAGPITLTSANRSGQTDAVDADEVVEYLGDDVQLVLDDGRSQFGQPSSVVRVDDNRLELLRKGVVSDSILRRLASFTILMVCTGNTCRSPMAEMLMRKRLASKLGCAVDMLEDHGVEVLSAGLAAMSGGRPTPEAVSVMREHGLNLSAHISQPLSDRLVRHADVILTMTRSHLDMVHAQWPNAFARTRLLRLDDLDVSDPVGGSLDVYRCCAEQIDGQLGDHLRQFDLRLLIGDVISGGESVSGQ